MSQSWIEIKPNDTDVRWMVRLSNDEVYYEGGSDCDWQKVREYCYSYKVHVVQMFLRFRSHVMEVLPANALGYFLVKRASAVWGSEESTLSYVAGTLQNDGLVHLTVWKTPELIPLGEEVRKVDPDSPSLILRQQNS